MLAILLKGKFKATAQVRRASVQSMSQYFSVIEVLNGGFDPARSKTLAMMRGFFAAFALCVLQISILTPAASAAALQSNAGAAAPPEVAPLSPAFSESLRPALQQVGTCVGQLQIDHWKLSQSWKVQLHSDADSIEQDLSHQLPGLFQQAQASPTALDAQLRVMQNVDALYDVLVRLTMAADLTEKKTDAAMLDSVLDRLEAARKTATGQLVSAAGLETQQLVQLQARVEENPASQNVSGSHAKTIVVDNEVRHGTRHRTTHHRKPVPSSTGATQSSGEKPAPQN